MDGIEYSFAGLVDKAAFGHFKAKKILAGFSHYDVWLYQHSLAFTVAKMMDADMLAEVKDAVEAAQRNGTAFADFKKRLKPYLMAKGWWGEQIMTDPLDGEPKLVQLGSTRRLKTCVPPLRRDSGRGYRQTKRHCPTCATTRARPDTRATATNATTA